MLKDLFGMKAKKKSFPMKEKKATSVPSQRFNDMIEYYTAELKSRIGELAASKAENEMLIKTSIKNAARSDELRLQLQKTQDDLRVLQGRLAEKK